ncbi:hypothetical protein EI94DRAFT_1705880 [Lactarius quietus]|nr:hypothetical protein EI94DRAFT_1705880 [Lactarius quietus]
MYGVKLRVTSGTMVPYRGYRRLPSPQPQRPKIALHDQAVRSHKVDYSMLPLVTTVIERGDTRDANTTRRVTSKQHRGQLKRQRELDERGIMTGDEFAVGLSSSLKAVYAKLTGVPPARYDVAERGAAGAIRTGSGKGSYRALDAPIYDARYHHLYLWTPPLQSKNKDSMQREKAGQ